MGAHWGTMRSILGKAIAHLTKRCICLPESESDANLHTNVCTSYLSIFWLIIDDSANVQFKLTSHSLVLAPVLRHYLSPTLLCHKLHYKQMIVIEFTFGVLLKRNLHYIFNPLIPLQLKSLIFQVIFLY